MDTPGNGKRPPVDPPFWRPGRTIPIVFVLFFLGLILSVWVTAPYIVRLLGLLLMISCLFTVCCYSRLLWVTHQALTCQNGHQYQKETRKTLKQFFHVQVHHWRRYDARRDTPVIFLVKHLKYGTLECFALPLMKQRRTKIVTVVHSSPSTMPLRQVLDMVGHIPLVAGAGYQDFMTHGKKALQDHYHLIVFPEGTHSNHKTSWKQLATFQTGVFHLASETDTRVVPVLFEGFRDWRGYMTPGTLGVHFLDPLNPADFESAESLRDASRRVMQEKLDTL